MTPAARIAAAIEVLDRIVAGDAAERALTAWARGSRFAGSKDRAAIRDHVFGVLRKRRSCAVWGGGTDGRALMIGALLADGIDPATMFTGEGHAPAPLAEGEGGDAPQGPDALDLPDWLLDRFRASLGDQAEAVAEVLRHRAPIMLRVNLRKGGVDGALASLFNDGVEAEPDPISPTALRVSAGERRIRLSAAYADGLVELQDGSSQAAVDELPLESNWNILDFCAGGGGKILAMAGRVQARITAHDADPNRLKDLEPRAERAGVDVAVLPSGALTGPYDLVLADVPCSGSGTWRRAPEAKWALSPERLAQLQAIQAGILEQVAPMTQRIAYMTCSVLDDECHDQVAAFVARHPDWQLSAEHRWLPGPSGDGFYLALITR